MRQFGKGEDMEAFLVELSREFATNAYLRDIMTGRTTTLNRMPPFMTTAQRDVMVSPPTSFWIFNTTTSKYNFYNGSAWEEVSSA